jgi:hypothetical protein
MVGSRERQACHYHVGVTDRLDLLELKALSQGVEGGENLVEYAHHPFRGSPLCKRREVDDVRKKDRHLGM